MSTSPRHVFFATCAPGVEPGLFDEVKALRLARPEQQVGGVYFEGTLEDAWRANLWLRTAVRIFLRVARFPAKDADELYAGAGAVDWSAFVEPEGTLLVDSQTKDSQLTHTHFVQQRVKDAVVDGIRAKTGVRPSVSVEDPHLRIHAHLYKDRATLSVDTSGGSLHKRGWRRHQGRAPLSETLAAAVVMLSGWDRRSPLVDPFCGSGTIAIEAAALAGNVAPGRWRRFGFERWPGHDAAAFARMRAEAEAAEAFPKKLVLLGSDRDRDRVREARENAESAGFADRIRFERADARDLDFRPGWNAWIVTNLPYGVRVSKEGDVVGLHRRFGERLRERCDGYTLAALCGSTETARALAEGLGLERPSLLPLWNGALECELLRARIGEAEPEEGSGEGAPRRRRRLRERRGS
ncbi:MAG: THUMP domain-containing class I SAM-dependent RNA methyltransferase [Planctomycetota bacterium]|jgi:23S rRNA G2445 N2-methylase RlmL